MAVHSINVTRIEGNKIIVKVYRVNPDLLPLVERAETAAENAEESAGIAVDAMNDAEVFAEQAVTARDEAVTAKEEAEEARDEAVEAMANKVDRSGDTMTGNLSVPAVILPDNQSTPVAGMFRAKSGRPTYSNESAVESGLAFLSEVKKPSKTISTTTYTLIASDANRWLVFTNASGCVVTVPANIFANGDFVSGRQGALGQVQFVEGSGANLTTDATDSLFTAGQGAVFGIQFESATTAHLFGKLELL